MPSEVCAVCGMGGYWVAYDAQAGEQRCVNHIGPTQAGPTIQQDRSE